MAPEVKGGGRGPRVKVIPESGHRVLSGVSVSAGETTEWGDEAGDGSHKKNIHEQMGRWADEYMSYDVK